MVTAECVAMSGGGGGQAWLRDRAVGFILRALGSHRGCMVRVEALKVSVVRPATSMPSSLTAPPWGAARLEHQAPLVTQVSPPLSLPRSYLDIISLDKQPRTLTMQTAQGRAELPPVLFLSNERGERCLNVWESE